MDKDYTILINREYPLPEDFIPEHLVDIGLPFDAVPGEPKRLLEEKTALSALELITRSRSEGLNLYCISGYLLQPPKRNFYRKTFGCSSGIQRTSERPCSGHVLSCSTNGAD